MYSIIIPTYNRRDFLAKTLDSVFNQTFKEFECLIVDDGSTDQTEEFVRSLTDERIRYFQKNNEGPAAARNMGLDQARGEWIAFLDSDDWWTLNKLERFSEAIHHHPQIRIFHSEEIWYKQGQRHNPKKKHQKPHGWVYPQAVPLCCISISTAVVHQDVFKHVGVFDPDLPACEDYDFWLRATHDFEIHLIEDYLTLKDGGRPDQLSFRLWGLDRYRIRALAKMLESNVLSSEYYAVTQKELKKKCQIYAQGARKRGREKEAQEYLDLLERFNIEK